MTEGRATARVAWAARLWRLALLAAAFTFSVNASAGAAGNACEHEIAAAARRYAIPVAVFYAVGLTETGRAGTLQPYAMNIDGRSSFSDSLAEAMQRFDEARKNGARMIDIGCMQINHHYHASRFASLAEMFDPGKNVDYAAHLLQQLKQREGTWTLAVAS